MICSTQIITKFFSYGRISPSAKMGAIEFEITQLKQDKISQTDTRGKLYLYNLQFFLETFNY
jgi:hypothetical protein